MRNKNLIGISGKLGSGKDTVGSIINYLVWKREVESGKNTSIHYSLKDFTYNYSLGKYKTKKFADKLKDIVCMLIGCTRAQLEDRDFKEKELGEEWWYYLRLGKMESYLENKHFDYLTTPLIRMTPRLLLQLLGTDAGRNIIHPNIWVNALMSEYKELSVLRDDIGNKIFDEKGSHQFNYPSWVVTDMRFPNELTAISSRGGMTIRVNRDIYKFLENSNQHQWSNNEDENVAKILRVSASVYSKEKSFERWKDLLSEAHESETALDNAEFDYVINNSGTIDDLVLEVEKILIKENIL